MMGIHPVCPSCGSKGDTGPGFNAFECFDFTKDPKRGDRTQSALTLRCLACTTTFPLWTYTIGDTESFKSNAVNDDGTPYDPAPEGAEQWWIPDAKS